MNLQKVVINNYIVSGGLNFGAMGRKYMDFDNDTTLLKNGFIIKSPYSNVPLTIIDTSGNCFQLLRYGMNAKGIGIFVGIGCFKEFNVTHGIRFNLNTKFYAVHSKVLGTYLNLEHSYFTRSTYNQNYFVGSISPELVHTIRLGGRTTFHYGVKAPYYFSLDKGKFRPTTNKELLSGFEVDLSIGLTYVIGKCD